MRHPRSTSHSASLVVALAGTALLVGCAPPSRPLGGTGGSSSGGAAGTAGAGGTTGSAGTGGATAGAGGGTTGTGGIATAGTGGRGGGAAGTGGPTAGTTGTAGAAAGGVAGTGTAGSNGGAGGSGGTGGSAPPRGPTPAANGVNFPFPQNRENTRCAYPTGYLNSDVMAAYAKWKTDTVVSAGTAMRRIQRTASDPVNMYTPRCRRCRRGSPTAC